MAEADTNHPAGAPERVGQHNSWWYWEKAAMALIGIGALMMFQPVVLALFTYSFDVILLGVVLFTIVSRKAD